MKNLTLIVLTAIIALAFAACGNDNDNPPQTCDCTVKVHPYGEPCDCGLADCDCTEAEESKDRSDITEPNETITINETEYDITIKGGDGSTFTDAEWNNATAKIKAALVSAYSNKPDPEMPDEFYQSYFPLVFEQADGVTIIMETFTGVDSDKSWKTTNDGKTLYINRVAVDTLSELGNAITALGDKQTMIGKAMPANRVFMANNGTATPSISTFLG